MRGLVAAFVSASALILVVIWWVNNQPPNLRIPSQRVPAKNGYDNFISAANLAANVTHKSPAILGAENLEARSLAHLRALVSELAPAHNQLREGLKLECVQPAVRSENDFGRQFKDLAWLRDLCRELTGEALYYEESGQPGKAVQSLLDGTEMCAELMHGSGLTGMPIGQMNVCLEPMESLIGKVKPTDLSHAGSRLDHILKVLPPFSDIMREEADSETTRFISGVKDGAFSNYGGILQIQKLTDSFGKANRSALSDRLRAASFMLANKSAVARSLHEYMNSLAAEAQRPYTGPSQVARPDNMECNMQLWMYDMYRPTYLSMQTRLILMRLEVALLEYRAAHGRYPNALSELAPKYIGRVPDDPFAGRAGVAPIYRVNSDRDYIMYSPGPNLVDNGGQTAVRTSALDADGNPTMPDSTGDIVAGKLFQSSPINP